MFILSGGFVTFVTKGGKNRLQQSPVVARVVGRCNHVTNVTKFLHIPWRIRKRGVRGRGIVSVELLKIKVVISWLHW